jgi:hypothetical protein
MWRASLTAVGILLTGWAAAEAPPGWHVAGTRPGDFDFGSDTAITYGSSASGYIRSRVQESPGYGSLLQTISARHYRGTRLRLSAFLKTDRAERAQMWMRIDAAHDRVLGFDNMGDRPLSQSTDWTRYEIVLDVPADATSIVFGFLLRGSGTIWADGFRLERVDATVPLTVVDNGTRPDEPQNPNFETH